MISQFHRVAVTQGMPRCSYQFGSDDTLSVSALELIGAQRSVFRRDYGFVVASNEMLTVLTKMLHTKSVLDAGSGSGWLSAALRVRGVDILACDRVDYRLDDERFLAKGLPLYPVYQLDHEGDAADLLPGKFDAVLLVWPNVWSDFAERVIDAMAEGQMLIFNGEERRGSCATSEFFESRDKMFDRLPVYDRMLNKYHVSFPLTYDKWWVGVKRKGRVALAGELQ